MWKLNYKVLPFKVINSTHCWMGSLPSFIQGEEFEKWHYYLIALFCSTYDNSKLWYQSCKCMDSGFITVNYVNSKVIFQNWVFKTKYKLFSPSKPV